MTTDTALTRLPPGADSAGLFPRRRLVFTIVLAVIGLLTAVLTSVFSEDDKSAAPDATLSSESAIGHKAFLTMLGDLQLDAQADTNPLMAMIGGDGVMIFLEPNPSEIAPADLKRRFKGTAVLVVLPKWLAVPDTEKPRFIQAAQWMESKAVQEMARTVAADATIERATVPVTFGKSAFNIAPLLTRPQLIVSSKLTPLIAAPEGILLGSTKQGKTTIYILSDPDLLNNHGLVKGNNAALDVRIVDKARNKGMINFDGSVQKFHGAVSMWRQLFLPPLLGLLLLTLAGIGLLIWHSAQRLLPPRKVDAGLARGKLGLVENSAALFDPLEHRRFLKQRYLDSAVADIAAIMPGVARAQGTARIRALEALGANRKVSDSFSDLQNLVDIEGVSASVASRRIYAWKQEILRGAH
jgi:hypothetical protein